MGTSLLPCSDQHVPLHSVGRRIWCRFAGTPENPPLLLLHGEWQSSAVFTPYFESLSRHYYVVAPDLLGHGFSSKPVEQSAYTISAWVEDLASLYDTTLHLDDIHVVAVGRFGLCLLDVLQWHVVMAERLRGFALLPFPCAYPLSLLKHLASTDVDISYNAAQELTMVLSPLFPQDGVGVERVHGELLSQVRLVHPQANHVLCHLVEHMETEYTRWQTPLMILQTLKNLSCLVPQSDVSLVAETDSQEENQMTDTVPFSLPCVPDLSC